MAALGQRARLHKGDRQRLARGTRSPRPGFRFDQHAASSALVPSRNLRLEERIRLKGDKGGARVTELCHKLKKAIRETIPRRAKH